MKRSVKLVTVLTLVVCVLCVCACNDRNADNDNVIEPTNTPEKDQNELKTDDNDLVDDEKEVTKVTFDFSKGSADANHEFSDYLKDNEDNYDLKGGVEKIGESDKKGYMLYANNQGDNLFMYVIMPVMLKSNIDYSVKGNFNISSDIPSDSSASVKAGVVSKVPDKQLDESDYYRIDIDKGSESSEGKDIANIGTVENEDEVSETIFTTKSYEFESDVVSDVNGNAYIIVGVVCGEKVSTTVYLENLTAEFIEK